MPSPLVSICIPAYKAEKYLAAALASVRAQTAPNWEIIVTEDGSRDSAEKIVRDFAATVSQPVTYNRHDVNQGLPITRNTGIASARGEWIAFLDADDLWTPDHLEKLRAATAASGDLAFSASQIFDDATGAKLELRAPTSAALADIPAALFLGHLVIQPSSVMIRREVLAKVGGFDPRCPICNDLDYWLRTAIAGGAFRYSGATTCLYRKHPQAMSLKAAALIAETASICERHGPALPIPAAQRRRRIAGLLESAGRILLREDPAAARLNFSRARRQLPASPKLLSLTLAAAGLSLFKGKKSA